MTDITINKNKEIASNGFTYYKVAVTVDLKYTYKFVICSRIKNSVDVYYYRNGKSQNRSGGMATPGKTFYTLGEAIAAYKRLAGMEETIKACFDELMETETEQVQEVEQETEQTERPQLTQVAQEAPATVQKPIKTVVNRIEISGFGTHIELEFGDCIALANNIISMMLCSIDNPVVLNITFHLYGGKTKYTQLYLKFEDRHNVDISRYL